MRAFDLVNRPVARKVDVARTFGRHSRAIGGAAGSQIALIRKKNPRF
jgi:hypothetical protein